MQTSVNQFERITFKHALNLAAPHTWAASVLPVCVASAAAQSKAGCVDALTVVVLLLIATLMQSAVNTLNDYFDYVKGSDSASDDVDESDSVLVYNNIKPKNVMYLGMSFLCVAFLLGIYIIYLAGFTPLVIALIGALFVFIYSGGKLPISYLPVGEFVSGFVMGGLISLASYISLTKTFSWLVLVWAIPEIIGIALIMLTNNTCDIEKDTLAHRKTFSVCCGRQKAKLTYRIFMALWCVCIVVNVFVWFRPGVALILPCAFASYSAFMPLWKNPLLPNTRRGAMLQICSLNLILGAFYVAMLAM